METYERREVFFSSGGARCAAWYYVPSGAPAGKPRPVIVMAHGYSAVKECFLDNFAEKFAAAGFVVLVFDYRHFGASEGEPRQQLFWWDQINDYRNAITWASLQPEVDAARIGVWGTSYSGGHVIHLASFDRRVKALVAQVPYVNVFAPYLDGPPPAPETLAKASARFAKARTEHLQTGKIAYLPVVAPEGQPCVLPAPEAYQWFTTTGSRRAPRWANRVSVESLEAGMDYDPTAFIHLISPTPLLMVIASDDIITPTAFEKQAFELAKEPKKLVIVPGRHFDAYEGEKHLAFVEPALDWFRRHLTDR